jgi:hypothetical protein
VSASASDSGYIATMRWTMSICSRAAVTDAASPVPGGGEGTYTDQNCAPTPPVRSLARSVCRPGCGCRMSSFVRSNCAFCRTSHG